MGLNMSENRTDQTAGWEAAGAEARARRLPATVLPVALLREQSAFEILNDLLAGKVAGPPFAELLDYDLIEAAPGRVVFQGTPDRRHYNPFGTAHGGYVTAMLDSAAFFALMTKVPKGQGMTTLEIKVNFVRAITAQTGPIRAEGSVVNLGRTIGVGESRLIDARGTLLAYASTTCMVLTI